jgi:hypothetical protein
LTSNLITLKLDWVCPTSLQLSESWQSSFSVDEGLQLQEYRFKLGKVLNTDDRCPIETYEILEVTSTDEKTLTTYSLDSSSSELYLVAESLPKVGFEKVRIRVVAVGENDIEALIEIDFQTVLTNTEE